MTFKRLSDVNWKEKPLKVNFNGYTPPGELEGWEQETSAEVPLIAAWGRQTNTRVKKSDLSHETNIVTVWYQTGSGVCS